MLVASEEWRQHIAHCRDADHLEPKGGSQGILVAGDPGSGPSPASANIARSEDEKSRERQLPSCGRRRPVPRLPCHDESWPRSKPPAGLAVSRGGAASHA